MSERKLNSTQRSIPKQQRMSSAYPLRGIAPSSKAVVAAVSAFVDPNQKSPFLDHLCRFLGTVRGTDKTLMFVAYFSKILGWYYKRNGKPSVATRIANFGSPVSDFRMLLRYYGLLPMLQWAKSVEQDPPQTKLLKKLDRAEVIVNMCYYPLEHIYWLAAHNIIPISTETANKISMWSCRFWATYVTIHFFHLAEEYRLLNKKRLRLKQDAHRNGEDSNAKDEKSLLALEGVNYNDAKALAGEYKALALNTIINAAYFPLTIHWSLAASTFPDVAVGVCGSIAAVAQFYTAWQSS